MRAVVRLLAGFVACLGSPEAALAEAFFSDGYLGLTQEELRAKLGPPHKIRDRSSALRVYKYYPYDEWENVMKDQIPGAMGRTSICTSGTRSTCGFRSSTPKKRRQIPTRLSSSSN